MKIKSLFSSFLLFFGYGLLLVLFVACGKEDNPSRNPGSDSEFRQTSNFSYEYSAEGCTTGYHQFTNQRDLCLYILNDENNHYCARERRLSDYELVWGCGASPDF